MTDKEFKRLTRSQLIDIIYQLQLNEEKLLDQTKKLKEALDDKRIRMEKAGSIAEAAIIEQTKRVCQYKELKAGKKQVNQHEAKYYKLLLHLN